MNNTAFRQARDEMADGMARICRLYGVSPLAGRLYSSLFLSAGPVSLEALSEGAGVAKSSTSVALRKLESARVARRLPPRSDRRDFYELVADPWAIFADWTHLYFRPELEMFARATRSVLDALDALDTPDGQAAVDTTGHEVPLEDAPDADARAVLRERMGVWREFAQLIAGLLGGVQPATAVKRPARRIPITVEGAPR